MLQINGTIIAVMPLTEGQGKNGPWKKKDFILRLESKFEKKLVVSLWGDKIEEFPLVIGSEAEVMFDIESREYNGRWYTEAKAWRVNLLSAGSELSDEAPKEEELPF